ncbi:AEC family transporter [Cellvibrio sp. pealriver]|uniref:AEC family transporter n=1 Tax=Cellvibrio sp. pealriver TaxID=1622269 RepID=UPI00066FDD8B|nr:AEC family transporter [Cellvibrio sp. pealriver]
MLSELLAILAPIVISVGAGFIWGKTGTGFPSDFISRIVMNIGSPCLIISVMAKVEVQPEVMGQVALATAFTMTAMGLFGWLLLRWMRLEIATYLPPLVFPNNGNMGLPLCLFAYGQTGLALALGSFMVMMIATFTVGLLIVANSEGGIFKRMESIAKQPVIYAMAIAVILLITDTDLPRWISNTVDLLGGIAIPLMTIALGVSLATLKIHSWKRSLLFSVIRVGGGLVLGFIVCELMGLTGVSRNVVLLQSAMPIAVFNYLLALRYGHKPEEVAAMVVVSTLVAFMGLPFLLMVIL